MLDEGSLKMVIYIYIYVYIKLKKKILIEFILVFYKMVEYYIVNNIINLYFFLIGF